jgi:hypothetical protein
LLIGKKYNLEKKETRALGDGHQARVELGGAAFGAAFDNPSLHKRTIYRRT